MTEQEAFQILARFAQGSELNMFTHKTAKGLMDKKRPDWVESYDDEPLDMIICRPCDDQHPLLNLDNKIDVCTSCQRRVQFRPHCPKGPKTCVFCAVTRLLGEQV